VESIKKIGVEKLKVPISDRCIPTPTFLVTEWEFSITRTAGLDDADEL